MQVIMFIDWGIVMRLLWCWVQIIAYAILDVLAKAVFGFIILSGESTPSLPEPTKRTFAK